MSYARAELLVETDWLADHLEDPDLRIFDCTTHLIPDTDKVFTVKSGLADYQSGHIPGAGYFDLQADLSDPASQFRFTTPGAEAFATALGAKGLCDGNQVVLYSTTSVTWSTRIWWMLHAFGVDKVSILNGGWRKWRAEGRAEGCSLGARLGLSVGATLGARVGSSDGAWLGSRVGLSLGASEGPTVGDRKTLTIF